MRLLHYRKLSTLALLLGFSFVVVYFRYHQTGVAIFRFFWWNLLLALIPWGASEALGRSRWADWMLLVIAVLFLPNAPYMITDMFHLRSRAEFPLWYDTLLIFWFAAVGVALFYVALYNLVRHFSKGIGDAAMQVLVLILCYLSGFGIYLGRYLRFNSWDLVANANDLAEQVLDRVINPSAHTRFLGVTLLYGTALWVGWLIVWLWTRPAR